MKIKGCLWKEGVNGLGVRGIHKLPYRKLFDKAARIHDSNYDDGCNSYNRYIADTDFLMDCISVCSNDIQSFFAIFYFIIVRLFGWLFFNYK